MMPLAAAEHFAGPPDWTWYILFYFFLAGLAGGSYVIATLLRHWGEPSDEPAARLGYTVAFPIILVCPILLAVDLGKPALFWHMLVNTTAGAQSLNFKARSPMSIGSWALLVFSLFAAVSFLEALVHGRVIRLPLADRSVPLLDGTAGKVWNVVGAALGLFVAGYTGVLLAVSNQPVWSDTWTLGGLFLASGLSGSAALLVLLVRYRPEAQASAGVLTLMERLFALLELALLVIFALALIPAGTIGDAFGFPWILLWLVALAGLVPGLGGRARAGPDRGARAASGGDLQRPVVSDGSDYGVGLAQALVGKPPRPTCLAGNPTDGGGGPCGLPARSAGPPRPRAAASTRWTAADPRPAIACRCPHRMPSASPHTSRPSRRCGRCRPASAAVGPARRSSRRRMPPRRSGTGGSPAATA